MDKKIFKIVMKVLSNIANKYQETTDLVEDNLKEIFENEKSIEEVFYYVALLLSVSRLVNGLIFHASVVFFIE